MRKKIIGIFLALAILLIYRGSAKAASEAFSVKPVIEEITLTPGEKTTYELNIANNSDRPLGIHADVASFQTPDDGAKDNPIPSPLISWTDVSPSDMIIPTHEQKKLTISITPPTNLKKGGYYAAIFLTPFISKPKDPKSPVILTQVGTLVLAQYGETDYTHLKEKAMIADMRFSRPVLEQAPFDFNFTVKNEYFTHFTAKPFLTLTPLFGKPERIQLVEKHILPSKSKMWHESISPQSFSLFYQATLAVSVGGGNYISQRVYLVVIPGLHYILLVTILLFLGIVATYHKRFRKAVRIFFTGHT